MDRVFKPRKYFFLVCYCCEATRLCSRLFQVAHVTSLGYLCRKPASNMYVCHRICLNFKYSPQNQGSFVCSQSIQKENKRTFRTQIKYDVENLKPGEILFGIESHVFASEDKKFPWIEGYISQNISSNSWNSTVSKVSVLAKFVFSQALLYLFNW